MDRQEIVDIRKKLGLNQHCFSKLLGTTQPHLSNVEHGKVKLTNSMQERVKFVKMIAEIFLS